MKRVPKAESTCYPSGGSRAVRGERRLARRGDEAVGGESYPHLPGVSIHLGLLPKIRQQGQFDLRTISKGSGGVEHPAGSISEPAGSVRFGDTPSAGSEIEPVPVCLPDQEPFRKSISACIMLSSRDIPGSSSTTKRRGACFGTFCPPVGVLLL